MPTKERIIEQSLNMFIYDGVRSIRMDDIAAALYISKRTLYEIFGDKESLLIECINHFHNQILQKQQLASKDAQNVIEELMISLEQWELYAEQSYKLMTSIHKFYPRVYSVIQDTREKEGNAELRRRLEKGIEQDLFLNDVNLDIAMAVFSTTLSGIIANSKNILDKDAFMYVIMYFFRGIATSKGIKLIDKYRIKMNFSLGQK